MKNTRMEIKNEIDSILKPEYYDLFEDVVSYEFKVWDDDDVRSMYYLCVENVDYLESFDVYFSHEDVKISVEEFSEISGIEVEKLNAYLESVKYYFEKVFEKSDIADLFKFDYEGYLEDCRAQELYDLRYGC